jgi:hypothetical protein
MTTAPNDPDDETRTPAQGVHGDTPDPAEDDDPPSPAFDIDLDPEDQGKAETAAANPD